MDGPVLAEVFVALSVDSSGSMPEMRLSSGFNPVSVLKIPGWISRSGLSQCTLFRKAYILSGSGFLEFLYSIIESFKKPVKLLSLFLISCVFTKKTLANFCDMEISLLVLPCHFIG